MEYYKIDDEMLQNFGPVLREIRESTGTSLSDVENETRILKSNICTYESHGERGGKRLPSLLTLVDYLEACGYSLLIVHNDEL